MSLDIPDRLARLSAWKLRRIGVVFGLLTFADVVYAQFSPGELAAAHAHLEGINNCTQCHDLGKKIDNGKCIVCHHLIKTRVEVGTGYHASAEVRGKLCYTCHRDHNGRGFAMIEWKPSKEKFDHRLTGYVLEDKHRTETCDVCHRRAFIDDRAVLQREKDGLDPDRTFLGLSQDCRICHFDEHRGQLDKCESCHDFAEWKKSAEAKFDHKKSGYPLTGQHVSVSCEKCHPSVADRQKKLDGHADDGYFKYRLLSFSNCTPCHADVHQNRFGQDCASCHATKSWREIRHRAFDHNLTRYPLQGRHTTVACERCHQPDSKRPPVYRNMAFASCSDCHRDAHLEQLVSRTDRGRCESCHDLEGFRPSRFTVERHRTESRFELTGKHLDTSCEKCHIKLPPREFKLRTGLSPQLDSNAIVLRFADIRCMSCHEDVHGGQFAEKLKNADCNRCHTAVSWKDLVFNHAKDSRFALLGKHQTVECRRCHPNTSLQGKTVVWYRPLSGFCENCHRDIHEGQLMYNKTATEEHPKTLCEQCHSNDAFKPSIFDHNRQSRFLLIGAHLKVECVKCHPKAIIRSDTLNTLYKPIQSECASCHPDPHEGVFGKP